MTKPERVFVAAIMIAAALVLLTDGGCAPLALSQLPTHTTGTAQPSIRWASENHLSLYLFNDDVQNSRDREAIVFANVPTYGCPTTPLEPLTLTLPGFQGHRMKGVLQPDACTAVAAGPSQHQCVLTIANQGPGHTTIHVTQGRGTACYFDKGLHYAN